MTWEKELKERYIGQGWNAFRTADEAFKKRLEKFCAERKISIIDDQSRG